MKLPKIARHETVDKEVCAGVQGQEQVGDRGRDQGPELDCEATILQTSTVFF
jgi:hypothetical protein